VAVISLSEGAAQKIKQLVADKGEGAGLRVKVVGGGCSGLQYRMEIDAAKERDKVFERDGARLIVDKKSFLSAVADVVSRSSYERVDVGTGVSR
jgi:iron-sulfur cluster assembly protein